MKYIIGIDLGTSAVKTVLVNTKVRSVQNLLKITLFCMKKQDIVNKIRGVDSADC